MNKKIIVTILIIIIIIASIITGISIFYNQKNNLAQHKSLLNKKVATTAVLKNNEIKAKIDPDTIILENNNIKYSTKNLITDTIEEWISKTQFNYVDFNEKATGLTNAQLEKLKNSKGMLYYSFIYANGPYATHKNITAQELNKTAIVVKEQLDGTWKPVTTGWSPSNS
ncbi:MAG: hypothetical protein ACRC41_11405 [Sarcina sp.]